MWSLTPFECGPLPRAVRGVAGGSSGSGSAPAHGLKPGACRSLGSCLVDGFGFSVVSSCGTAGWWRST